MWLVYIFCSVFCLKRAQKLSYSMSKSRTSFLFFPKNYLGYAMHMPEMTPFIFTLQTAQVQVLEIRINKLI